MLFRRIVCLTLTRNKKVRKSLKNMVLESG